MQAQRVRPLLILGLNLVVVLASSSCRQETKSSAAVDVSEIRGERISPAPTNGIGAKQDTIIPAASSVDPLQTAVKSEGPASSPGARHERSTDDPYPLGFDKLSAFTYEMPTDLLDTNQVAASPASDKIPATVRAFDQKAVALKGFMLPLKVEAGLVTELLILRDQTMCCYGAVPKINEWVSVKMAGKGVKPIMDQPVTLVGRLHVGEVRENGYLVGIYTMDGERIAIPPGL